MKTQLTIFALPKPFRGHIEVIQRNAMQSWTQLDPAPEILLFGDESGTAEIAQEFGLRHIPQIRRNEFGTPLVSDLFQQAQSAARHDTLCYVNSDIILLADFPQAVERTAGFREKFLMVGRRLDLDLAEPLLFDGNGWEGSLRSRALGQGRMNIARSIDYFVFPRSLYPPLPEMALGRFWWDNWLIWKARAVGAAVVDALGGGAGHPPEPRPLALQRRARRHAGGRRSPPQLPARLRDQSRRLRQRSLLALLLYHRRCHPRAHGRWHQAHPSPRVEDGESEL